MRLETFFQNYDVFAEAPGASARMSDLVLQLAVTGKLVPHDKRDQPASILLEAAAAERAELVGARRIKPRSTIPVELEDRPFDTPPGWVWARLADVGYELGPKVPDKRFTYIDVGTIDSAEGRISDRVEQLEPDAAPSRARKLVARGAVIYSTVRPYLRKIAIIDREFKPEPIASTAFAILDPFQGFDSRYHFYWLRSAPFTTYVQQAMKGMAYPAIDDEKFYSGFIAIPPAAEQKRIASRVDDLMALCDRLDAQEEDRESRWLELTRAALARFTEAPTPENLYLLFHQSYAVAPGDLRQSILLFKGSSCRRTLMMNPRSAAYRSWRVGRFSRRMIGILHIGCVYLWERLLSGVAAAPHRSHALIIGKATYLGSARRT
jgi:type I restriction enzyme S subunit